MAQGRRRAARRRRPIPGPAHPRQDTGERHRKALGGTARRAGKRERERHQARPTTRRPARRRAATRSNAGSGEPPSHTGAGRTDPYALFLLTPFLAPNPLKIAAFIASMAAMLSSGALLAMSSRQPRPQTDRTTPSQGLSTVAIIAGVIVHNGKHRVALLFLWVHCRR